MGPFFPRRISPTGPLQKAIATLYLFLKKSAPLSYNVRLLVRFISLYPILYDPPPHRRAWDYFESSLSFFFAAGSVLTASSTSSVCLARFAFRAAQSSGFHFRPFRRPSPIFSPLAFGPV